MANLQSNKQTIATGGASKNDKILQVMSDVFGCKVYKSEERTNSASLGAALRAIHALLNHKLREEGKIQLGDQVELIASKNKQNPGEDDGDDDADENFKVVCEPIQANHEIYNGLVKDLEILEELVKKNWR